MKLSSLLDFNEIVIQCHDNPDADTIASGFGVYCYFKANGKKSARDVRDTHELRKLLNDSCQNA